MPASGSDRDGIIAALAGFNAYIPPDHGSLVALVDFDDLTAAQQALQHSPGTRSATVLLVGVEGLNGGAQTARPVTVAAG